MKHGAPSLYILMNSPRFDFVFEADTDYDPIKANDQGGIVAFRDKDTRLELLEYYDPVTGTTYKYNRIRMIRRGDLWEGYGTDDNGVTWELIGVSYLSAPKVGLVLHGNQEVDVDTLDVKRVRMYRDTNIQVGNLMPGMKVQLLNSAGAVIREEICKPDADHVKLDVSTLTLPHVGKVRVYDHTGGLLEESTQMSDMWGGDIWWYGVKLDVEIDGSMLRQDREYQMGNMESGVIEKKIWIVNNNDIPLYNIRVSIQSYSEYFGWQWADIAKDVYNQPGSYQDMVFLGTIVEKDRVPLWVKITRQPEQQLASLNDYKFRLLIES